LHWSGHDGVFCDAAGKEVAFDPTTKEIGPDALLIREEEFQKYLLDNELDFFWTVLGAKQGMHGSINPETWNGELQISGFFQLIDGEVVGELTTNLITWDKNRYLGIGNACCTRFGFPAHFARLYQSRPKYLWSDQ